MYRRNYRDGEIEVPKNYGGSAFSERKEEKEEREDCCRDCPQPQCEEVHNSPCEDTQNAPCDEKRDTSGSIIENLFPSLSMLGDNSELLLLFLCVMLYSEKNSSSKELMLVLLFLLCMK